jgi:hypothetical protein
MKLVITSLVCVLLATACRNASQISDRPPTASVEPQPQRPTESQIRERIVGTWFLESWSPQGTPETITVIFGADGSFESSRNFTDLVSPPRLAGGSKSYRAMWQATDGYFTVTPSNSLPSCNLQMFVVDRLDDHEMVCGHPSVAGRDKFRR